MVNQDISLDLWEEWSNLKWKDKLQTAEEWISFSSQVMLMVTVRVWACIQWVETSWQQICRSFPDVKLSWQPPRVHPFKLNRDDRMWSLLWQERWNSPGIGDITFVASDSHHYVGWSVLAKLLHPVLQRLEWFLSERWVRSLRQATLLHHKTLRSLSTDPHVAQNLRGNSSSVEHKRSYLADCPSCSFPLIELECKLEAVKHHKISLYDLCMIYHVFKSHMIALCEEQTDILTHYSLKVLPQPITPLVFHGKKRSCIVQATWSWVDDDRTFIFGWTIPLIALPAERFV